MIRDYETERRFAEWMDKLPSFNFDKEWNVKILPPFANAIIRFHITHNDKFVSVYFDAYSELGYMYDENNNHIPYFEFYDGDEIYRYMLENSEDMMNNIRTYLNS